MHRRPRSSTNAGQSELWTGRRTDRTRTTGQRQNSRWTQVRDDLPRRGPGCSRISLPPTRSGRSAHRYDHYRGEPQRQAARAAVLNDGGSLIVALPTGRGKTAVAWSKALLSDRGVTIVVVPTVVLALDMERRTSEEANRGRATEPAREVRLRRQPCADVKKQLRDAVREGSQRLLYTSPEALVTGLAPALLGVRGCRYAAAGRDRRGAPRRPVGH